MFPQFPSPSKLRSDTLYCSKLWPLLPPSGAVLVIYFCPSYLPEFSLLGHSLEFVAPTAGVNVSAVSEMSAVAPLLSLPRRVRQTVICFTAYIATITMEGDQLNAAVLT